jgi:hypothetical protein
MRLLTLVVLTLCLSGCLPNEEIFVSVNRECPKYCSAKGLEWTGLIKPEPDALMCVCERILKDN